MSCGMGDNGPPNPDLLVPFVVRMFEALPVADDGPPAANRQSAEQPQRVSSPRIGFFRVRAVR